MDLLKNIDNTEHKHREIHGAIDIRFLVVNSPSIGQWQRLAHKWQHLVYLLL